MSEKKLAGITLIDEAEELVYQPYPVTRPHVKLIYRRVSETLREKWRGELVTDDRSGAAKEEVLSEKVWDYCLSKWEGIFTKDGELAKISYENIKLLEAWIITDLAQLMIGMKRGAVHNPLADLSTSQNSK